MNRIIRDFKLMSFADGQISSYQLESGVLTLHFLDWQERQVLIRWDGVLALKDLGILGSDILSTELGCNDPFLKEATKQHPDEDPKSYFCFQFYSAGSIEADLKIVAQNFTAEIIVSESNPLNTD